MAQNIPYNESGKENWNVNSGNKETVQEYVTRIPQMKSKHFNVMRFNSSMKVDVSSWICPKMEREDNLKEFMVNEELPKYGAGSEFGREQREEARRKKYGIISKKYNPDEQPWILKTGGKTGKKFKGIREGGVTEHASYYVFMQAPDGAFEVFPLEEWYSFYPIQCYEALSAEEAEEEFLRRDKVLNYSNIMLRKRLRAEQDEDQVEKGKEKCIKSLVHAELEVGNENDWMNLSDDSGDSTDNGDELETVASKKKKSGKNVKKKGKKQSSDVEALEESDGDFDNREVDYITDSSSSEEEPDEDFGKSDDTSEDEEEEKENKETEKSPEIKEKALESKPMKEKALEPKPMKEKALEPKPKSKRKKVDNSSDDSSSDTSDSDFDDPKFYSAMFMQKGKKKDDSAVASSSQAITQTRRNSDLSKEVQRGAQKRKLPDPSTTATKRSKLDPSSLASQSLSSTGCSDGITEDAIRRYLSRKSMTASELLQKFKSKKTGMNSDQLVIRIAEVLKKVNPVKQHINNKMYFFLKS